MKRKHVRDTPSTLVLSFRVDRPSKADRFDDEPATGYAAGFLSNDFIPSNGVFFKLSDYVPQGNRNLHIIDYQNVSLRLHPPYYLHILQATKDGVSIFPGVQIKLKIQNTEFYRVSGPNIYASDHFALSDLVVSIYVFMGNNNAPNHVIGIEVVSASADNERHIKAARQMLMENGINTIYGMSKDLWTMLFRTYLNVTDTENFFRANLELHQLARRVRFFEAYFYCKHGASEWNPLVAQIKNDLGKEKLSPAWVLRSYELATYLADPPYGAIRVTFHNKEGVEFTIETYKRQSNDAVMWSLFVKWENHQDVYDQFTRHPFVTTWLAQFVRLKSIGKGRMQVSVPKKERPYLPLLSSLIYAILQTEGWSVEMATDQEGEEVYRLGASCAACGAAGSTDYCGGCRKVPYCGDACAERDWIEHHHKECV